MFIQGGKRNPCCWKDHIRGEAELVLFAEGSLDFCLGSAGDTLSCWYISRQLPEGFKEYSIDDRSVGFPVGKNKNPSLGRGGPSQDEEPKMSVYKEHGDHHC